MPLGKHMHEGFARFFEQPTREALATLLTSNVGEMDYLDFKESWPAYPSLARHLLAFANYGGRAIVLGQRQEHDGSLVSVGVSEIRDKADITRGLGRFLPPTLEHETLDFSYKSSEYGNLVGKSFQVILIESDARKLPYLAAHDGDGVKSNAIYVRRGTESIVADRDEIERILNRRIESGYTSTNVLRLEEHLEQLKVLYNEIPRQNSIPVFAAGIANLVSPLFKSEPNPNYPKQSYHQYVAELIGRKKLRVEQVLELRE